MHRPVTLSKEQLRWYELNRRAAVKRLWIGGLALDYCVRASAIDAIREGFEVHLLVDGTRAVNVNPDDGQKALDEIRQAGGILGEKS